jgi:hypothetical protein
MNIQFFHMKKIITVLSFISFAFYASAQYPKLEHVFTLDELPALVEGMTYDPKGENFYFGDDINKRILRYTKSGKSAGFIDAAAYGLTGVAGMRVTIAPHELWVCGALDTGKNRIRCIFQFDLRDGSLIAKYPDTSRKATFFNDIAVTTNGEVIFPDSYSKSLYTADKKNKVAVLYMRGDSLSDGNGITADGNTLYISTRRGFTKLNTVDRSLSIVPLQSRQTVGNDGLYFYKNSLIGIQNVFYPFTVARYFIDDAKTKITHAKPLAVEDPSFRIPTTGAIVDNYFYFMTNNNLNSKTDLKKITVARIKLE